jgi:CheY-like chemotaxis protein
MNLRGKRILLVEDEYLIAQDMARTFAAAGATVIGPAATLAEALRLVAASGTLDGAVLDINLRGEQVYPVADALITRGVPFVFATGYKSELIPPRFEHHRRCEKPCLPDQVAAVLADRARVAPG